MMKTRIKLNSNSFSIPICCQTW